MTDEAMSPLRRRMIEDMTIRKLAPKTQQGYIHTIKDFAAFLGRSPATASFEDVRRFQLHLAASGAHIPILNHTVAALRFFFRVTLRRSEIIEHTTFVHEPRKLPVVLSPEEVARLLDAAPGLKYKAALGVAYGAGLRAAEVIALKIGDIDSKRMIIHVEQGKGRKDRYVMLSPHLLELLRAWWRTARPQGWLFPGQNRVNPMTTRQLNRACHAAAHRAEIKQARIAPHLAAQLRHSPIGTEHRYQSDPGAARARQARYHRALHARRHQDDPTSHEPTRPHHADADRAADLTRGSSCRAHRWRSQTSSATTARHGAGPMPAMSASAS
jgi:integrase/recombinase XerD